MRQSGWWIFGAARTADIIEQAGQSKRAFQHVELNRQRRVLHALDTRDPIGGPPVRGQWLTRRQIVGRQRYDLAPHGLMGAGAALGYTILSWLHRTGEPAPGLEESSDVRSASKIDRIHDTSKLAPAK